jgi:hypothetical protein
MTGVYIAFISVKLKDYECADEGLRPVRHPEFVPSY